MAPSPAAAGAGWGALARGARDSRRWDRSLLGRRLARPAQQPDAYHPAVGECVDRRGAAFPGGSVFAAAAGGILVAADQFSRVYGGVLQASACGRSLAAST